MLRWIAQVRTRNGGITTAVKVRGEDACEAAKRAQEKAYKQHGYIEEHQKRYRQSDWFVIYVGLYVKDHNNI